ncbi:MAG: hypothetical protein ACYDHZ_05395 [Dehalococcoidia bacterium]
MAEHYHTLTLCTDIDMEDMFGGTISDTGYKLDHALSTTTAHIPNALSTVGREDWEVISHSLTFVGNRCVFSVLLRQSHK